MDKKDEKILIELIKNSRVPMNQLSKKVGVSREVAAYRVSSLVKTGIIKQFYTEINESLLGFERFGCSIQLKGISESEERKLMNDFSQNKYVTYLGPTIGRWNFAFDIIAKSRENLEEIFKTLFSKYKDKIKKYVVNSTPTERGFFPAKVFNSTFEEKTKVPKKTNITKVDLEVLKLLRDNSRMEYSELSRNLKLTANAIKYRIKNLENSGVIDLYTIAIDYSKIGVEFYNLQLKFLDYDFTKLKRFLKENKFVKYFYKHIGNPNWDLDLGILVRDTKELRKFLTDIRESFGELIEINEIFLVPEAIKENIAPNVMFD